MITCDAAQERMTEIGSAALEEDAALTLHLAGCPACTALWEELQRLEADLKDLPDVDAPDALVAATLDKVRQAEAPPLRTGLFGDKRQQIAAALAASVVLAASLGLSTAYLRPTDERLASQMPAENSRAAGETANQQLAKADFADQDYSNTPSKTTERPTGQLGAAPAPQGRSESLANEGAGAPTAADEENAVLAEADAFEVRRQQSDVAASSGFYRPGASGRADDDRLGEEAELMARLLWPSGPDGEDKVKADRARAPDTRVEPELAQTLSSVTGDGSVAGGKIEGAETNAPLADTLTQSQEPGAARESLDAVTQLDDKSPAVRNDDKVGDRAEGGSREGGPLPLSKLEAELGTAEPLETAPQAASQAASQGLAAAFLRNLASLDGLTFQEPEGYWANSYIPGDPAMRLLAAQLLPQDRDRLEAQVRQVSQPFDAPKDAAMAVFLQADKTAIEGPTRLRLQVGLKGADRLSGQRSDINLALVLDLRSLQDSEEAARTRALVAALEEARRPGDRFSLIVAGPDGGLLVRPEDFLHGPITVAMTRLFGAAPDSSAHPMDLMPAMRLASETLRAGDDPNAVLGSSVLLLASGTPLTSEAPALETLAHENALAGLALSVVDLGTGDGGDLDAIDRLVAAGQGQRRTLVRAGDAKALVDRELHSASRAVARALRLRIRLAPGVQLVNVLGSTRLDALGADQVRAAEVAIDQRLARNLGIAADRGEDEEGIQIVIPSFFAGDDHVILLDVVAEAAGPLAEVTLRYKDLINHQNAVARASLSLPARKNQPDPLSQNVLKNRVAYELSSSLRGAARFLAAGQTQAAIHEIAGLIDLLRGLRSQVSGWSGDADLLADQTLLADYLSALAKANTGGLALRRQLVDSMIYAAHLKLQKSTPLSRSE